MIGSYSSIYNLGHAAIADLFKSRVIIEEKVDGSQISFGLNLSGELQMRSKGAAINILAPEAMFANGVTAVQQIAHRLRSGLVYRGEYLSSPHHNALTYSRIPRSHIIIFDINDGPESYLEPRAKRDEAERIGLECVPVLFLGIVADVKQFRAFLETESVLGGQKIEGVVAKPEGYSLFGRDKKVLMGKFVSEAFREVHSKTWDAEHKTKCPAEIIALLAKRFGTAARWHKAVIHLKERGLLVGDPRDIGLIMKEVPEDLERECLDQIKDDLLAWAWPQLRRRICGGLPEWYKEQLVKAQFSNGEE